MNELYIFLVIPAFLIGCVCGAFWCKRIIFEVLEEELK